VVLRRPDLFHDFLPCRNAVHRVDYRAAFRDDLLDLLYLDAHPLYRDLDALGLAVDLFQGAGHARYPPEGPEPSCKLDDGGVMGLKDV